MKARQWIQWRPASLPKCSLPLFSVSCSLAHSLSVFMLTHSLTHTLSSCLLTHSLTLSMLTLSLSLHAHTLTLTLSSCSHSLFMLARSLTHITTHSLHDHTHTHSLFMLTHSLAHSLSSCPLAPSLPPSRSCCSDVFVFALQKHRVKPFGVPRNLGTSGDQEGSLRGEGPRVQMMSGRMVARKEEESARWRSIFISCHLVCSCVHVVQRA